jgi:uncharacterized protein (TIGR03546 family)
MLKTIASFIVALNSNLKRTEIAGGFAWGVLLGLVPAGNALWVALFVISFFIRHHNASKVLVLAVLKILYALIDPALDQAGWWFLHLEPLQGTFRYLYNLPLVPITRFNNTIVAGGLFCGIIAAIVRYIAMFFFIPVYRNTLAPKIRNSKLVIALKKVPLISKLGNAVNKAQGLRDAVEAY